MGWMTRLLWLLSLVVAIGGADARAERRVALVLGFGAYQHAPELANPVNDATALAATLERLGFEVILGLDLERRDAERSLARFARALDGADTAILFYAGHGLQVAGANYLLPVDARLEHEADLPFEALRLTDLLAAMERGQRVNLVFLDACRDNPLARNLARSMGTRSASLGRGLATVEGAIGSLIAFATQPGNVALDGDGRHSPFTAALLEHLPTPDLEVRQILTRVRSSVIDATGGRQVPWDHSSLTADVYLARSVASEPPRGPAFDARQLELAFWESIKDSRQEADFLAYLDRFGEDGVFAPLARGRLAALPPPATAEPPSAPREAVATPEAQPGPEPAPTVDPAPTVVGVATTDPAAWRQIQRELAALGHDPGGADGVPGTRTRAAIGRWQASVGEPATGDLTEAQRRRLGDEAAPRLAALVDEAPARVRDSRSLRDCADCPELVLVPAGAVQVGSPPGEAGRMAEEGPSVRIARVPPFAIGRYEVTVGEWSACVGAAACAPLHSAGSGRRAPAAGVSFEQASRYVAWLSRRTGRSYRLPSEVEWEHAARGGQGKLVAAAGRAACDGCGSAYDNRGPAPVGSFAANAFSLHDMLGNLWEWTADCWNPRHDGLRGARARRDGDCGRRVVKGGSWASRPHRLRPAAREAAFVGDDGATRGVRVARDVD